jgi:hypothetical protein
MAVSKQTRNTEDKVRVGGGVIARVEKSETVNGGYSVVEGQVHLVEIKNRFLKNRQEY